MSAAVDRTRKRKRRDAAEPAILLQTAPLRALFHTEHGPVVCVKDVFTQLGKPANTVTRTLQLLGLPAHYQCLVQALLDKRRRTALAGGDGRVDGKEGLERGGQCLGALTLDGVLWLLNVPTSKKYFAPTRFATVVSLLRTEWLPAIDRLAAQRFPEQHRPRSWAPLAAAALPLVVAAARPKGQGRRTVAARRSKAQTSHRQPQQPLPAQSKPRSDYLPLRITRSQAHSLPLDVLVAVMENTTVQSTAETGSGGAGAGGPRNDAAAANDSPALMAIDEMSAGVSLAAPTAPAAPAAAAAVPAAVPAAAPVDPTHSSWYDLLPPLPDLPLDLLLDA